ncbi:MAG: DUF4430 domain-containing protein [Thermoplasmata archaeon]|nr:DUF4430 domain-containing protein [Thermoplasmata archaeon]
MTDDVKAGLGWKPIAVVFIVVSAALGGLLAYDKIMADDIEYEMTEATIKILHGGTVAETQTFTTGNNTPLGLLEEAVGYENIDMTYYEGMGYLVNKINGVGNGAEVAGIDDTSNYYWQYYVNDVLGPVSADRYALQDGDVLEWRFEEMIW